jgi:hypothetical protein
MFRTDIPDSAASCSIVSRFGDSPVIDATPGRISAGDVTSIDVS